MNAASCIWDSRYVAWTKWRHEETARLLSAMAAPKLDFGEEFRVEGMYFRGSTNGE